LLLNAGVLERMAILAEISGAALAAMVAAMQKRTR
jgi:hypothetical protein